MLTPQIIDLNEPYQEMRSEISAITYPDRSRREREQEASLRQDIEEIKKRTAERSTAEPDGSYQKHDYTYAEDGAGPESVASTKGAVTDSARRDHENRSRSCGRRRSSISRTDSEATTETLQALQSKVENFDISIRQIHVKDVDLVDRCESCHLGAREPVTLTTAAMGGERAFASHPNKELLKIHDPERFGCTPCHGGNGSRLRASPRRTGGTNTGCGRCIYPEKSRPVASSATSRRSSRRSADALNAGPRDFPPARLHGLPPL